MGPDLTDGNKGNLAFFLVQISQGVWGAAPPASKNIFSNEAGNTMVRRYDHVCRHHLLHYYPLTSSRGPVPFTLHMTLLKPARD